MIFRFLIEVRMSEYPLWLILCIRLLFFSGSYKGGRHDLPPPFIIQLEKSVRSNDSDIIGSSISIGYCFQNVCGTQSISDGDHLHSTAFEFC